MLSFPSLVKGFLCAGALGEDDRLKDCGYGCGHVCVWRSRSCVFDVGSDSYSCSERLHLGKEAEHSIPDCFSVLYERSIDCRLFRCE